jgi:hypothetical protein
MNPQTRPAQDIAPGSLVVMPGGYVGIILQDRRVLSLSDPSWVRDKSTWVTPLRSGATVTLEQE